MDAMGYFRGPLGRQTKKRWIIKDYRKTFLGIKLGIGTCLDGSKANFDVFVCCYILKGDVFFLVMFFGFVIIGPAQIDGRIRKRNTIIR